MLTYSWICLRTAATLSLTAYCLLLTAYIFLDLPEDGRCPVAVVHLVDEPQEHILQVVRQILRHYDR